MRIIVFIATVIFSSSLFGQVTLLEENFDTPGLPAGWERIDNDGNTPASQVSDYTDAWIYKEDPLNSGNGTFSSTSFFDPIDRADRWLISPSITLGSSGNFISWKGLSGDPSFPDSYKVVISTTTNDIASFTDTLAIILEESPDWSEYTESLEEYANQTIHVAFVNTTFDGFKLYLDSIHVREQDPLNIAYEEDLDLSVYPNPAANKIIAQSTELISSVTVYSALGECVKKVENNKSQQTVIDLENLTQGIYHLQIRLVSGRVITRKIVKK